MNSNLFITASHWPIEEMTGYKPKTTFWLDFTIADNFGPDAVKDTYNRAFEEWKTDHVYLTELVMVLNWKIWQHYEHNDELAKLYNDLWAAADSWAVENLTGAELDYFYTTTD
jgi:hypothetical protein